MNWLIVLIALAVIQAVGWPVYCLLLVRRIRRIEAARRREWVREYCAEQNRAATRWFRGTDPAALKRQAIDSSKKAEAQMQATDKAIKNFFGFAAQRKRREIDEVCRRLIG